MISFQNQWGASVQDLRLAGNVGGGSSFNGYISGTTLTVTGAVTGAPLAIGHVLTGPLLSTLTANTQITGGTGPTYTVNNSQTAGSAGSPIALGAINRLESFISFDTQAFGNGVVVLYNSVKRVYMGSYGGYEAAPKANVNLDGIRFNPLGGINGDSNMLEDITVYGGDGAGIHVVNGNAGLFPVTRYDAYFLQNALYCELACSVVANSMFAGNILSSIFKLAASSNVTAINMLAETNWSMWDFVGNNVQLNMIGGNYQIGPGYSTDGVLGTPENNSEFRVSFTQGFGLNTQPGYSGQLTGYITNGNTLNVVAGAAPNDCTGTNCAVYQSRGTTGRVVLAPGMVVTDGANFSTLINSNGTGTGGTGTYNIGTVGYLGGTVGSVGAPITMTAGKTVSILLYPTAGSAGSGQFECEGCRGVQWSMLKMLYNGSYFLNGIETRNIIYHPSMMLTNVPKSYSRWAGNYYQPSSYGPTLTPNQIPASLPCQECTNQEGQWSLGAGPLNIWSTVTPGLSASCTGGGATAYSYRVTSRSQDGSSPPGPSAPVTCGATLSDTNFVTLSLTQLQGIFAYDIWKGTTVGSERYLTTVVVDNISNPQLYIDNGSINYTANALVTTAGPTNGNLMVDGMFGQGVYSGGCVSGCGANDPTVITGASTGFESMTITGATGWVGRGQTLRGTGAAVGTVIGYIKPGSTPDVYPATFFVPTVNTSSQMGNVWTLDRLLPTCSSVYWGRRAMVADANVTTFHSAYVPNHSAGSMVPVYCDRTNTWLIGG
jgi:hypothetical protein